MGSHLSADIPLTDYDAKRTIGKLESESNQLKKKGILGRSLYLSTREICCGPHQCDRAEAAAVQRPMLMYKQLASHRHCQLAHFNSANLACSEDFARSDPQIAGLRVPHATTTPQRQ